MLARLDRLINADTLDLHELQRALSTAADCDIDKARSGYAAFNEAVTRGKELLEALRALEQAQSQGRKAHAQLLVSQEHDVRHIARLADQLDKFVEIARKTRTSSNDPTHIERVHELLAKWRREEGPSQILKTAVAGADAEVLRAAITQAKDAGIGIKAAKKKLAQLELVQKSGEELREALAGSDTARLKQAVSAAAKCGIDVSSAKETLAQFTVRDACIEQLRSACHSHREERLEKAIAKAKAQGIDCAEAEELLQSLVIKLVQCVSCLANMLSIGKQPKTNSKRQREQRVSSHLRKNWHR